MTSVSDGDREQIHMTLKPLRWTLVPLGTSMALLGFYSKSLFLSKASVLAGLLLLGILIISQMSVSRDPFHPLVLLFGVWSLRIFLPIVVIIATGMIPERQKQMGLSTSDTLNGVLLAMVAFYTLFWSWLVVGQRSIGVQLETDADLPLGFSAACGFIIGAVGFYLLIVLNTGSLVGTVFSGEFRALEIQEGTGVYKYLSYFLIGAAVFLTGFIVNRLPSIKISKPIAMGPALVVGFAYFVTGARSRALIPIIASGLFLYYHTRSATGWPSPTQAISQVLRVAVVGIPIFFWFLRTGRLYRGGGGTEIIPEVLSITGYLQFVREILLTGLPVLRGLGGSVRIGPGVMGGKSYHALLWPLTKQDVPPESLSGKNPGQFIIEALLGVESFGTHPTMAGGSYLNFGMLGTVIVFLVLGAGLSLIYHSMRRGRLHVGIYSLAAVTIIRMINVHINKWAEVEVMVGGAVVIYLTGKALSSVANMEMARRAHTESQ